MNNIAKTNNNMTQTVFNQQAKTFIQNKIATNDAWVKKALLLLYERQTADEQNVEHTIYYNNAGFNGADSKFMTSVAKFYIRTGYMSERQVYAVRKRMKKYWYQILQACNRAKLETQMFRTAA